MGVGLASWETQFATKSRGGKIETLKKREDNE